MGCAFVGAKGDTYEVEVGDGLDLGDGERMHGVKELLRELRVVGVIVAEPAR